MEGDEVEKELKQNSGKQKSEKPWFQAWGENIPHHRSGLYWPFRVELKYLTYGPFLCDNSDSRGRFTLDTKVSETPLSLVYVPY